MNDELVTVICLCHNQASFVDTALSSVLNQTHPYVELIIVDDGSIDGSKDRIRDFLKDHPHVPFVDHPEPLGNCKAFNTGWKLANGQYIIDLAADDVLFPERIQAGIERLKETSAGVHFSDAWLIDTHDNLICRHNERFDEPIPEGDIYQELVREYLICPPTMMIRQEVMVKLGGYDEALAYEDFDFWVRSSRDFQYAFTDVPLVKKRLVAGSHSTTQNKFRNRHQRSTMLVCKKILAMNHTPAEGKALKQRITYEIWQCIKKGNLGLIPDYLFMLKQC